MDQQLSNFDDEVVMKYHLYNALFLTLPFSKTEETGTLLPLFSAYCRQQIAQGCSPAAIITSFFAQEIHTPSAEEQLRLLFRLLQFVERQILLFDALEDAAFPRTHNMNGPGSLTDLLLRVTNANRQQKLIDCLHNYGIRIVLTAHPTQFYPAPILGILTQLQAALPDNKLKEISQLLLQMGKTSFKYSQKPTPYQEAASLVWYLEHVFYPVAPHIQDTLNRACVAYGGQYPSHNAIEIGFWPGGDRDGNPFVTAETTLDVARLLKTRILRCYVTDLRRLVGRLTFAGILPILEQIKQRVEQTQLHAQLITATPDDTPVYHNSSELLHDLTELRALLIEQHDGLFIEVLDQFITKVRCFGFHFAAMDMRENATVHRNAWRLFLDELQAAHPNLPNGADYAALPEAERITLVTNLLRQDLRYTTHGQEPAPLATVLAALATFNTVQNNNGEIGLCRYVISNTAAALDVLELLALLTLAGGFADKVTVDIIPLFESIADLEHAATVMEALYRSNLYRNHLRQRRNTQVIMLGFSDGTKDGGYVTANWSIYFAKLQLTALAQQYDVRVVFFDGRGGPPGRGGGNTHAFYRSLGDHISHQQLQLTVQGQTISSNFGTPQSARYNLEQLFTAGLEDQVFPEHSNNLNAADITLLQQLSAVSRTAYQTLKDDPCFVPYLEKMTPLRFFNELNIGSRPTTRKASARLQFGDLRAIPFVSSWSQLKQNVPGYYGFGYALQQLVDDGKSTALQDLYRRSLFFRTLVENAMMSLSKSFFPLTAYMRTDPEFGGFWQQLSAEAQLAQQQLLHVAGQQELLASDPMNRTSIQLREEIVLPLLIIQQFAMMRLGELDEDSDEKQYAAYKHIVLKALAANTNASRNAA